MYNLDVDPLTGELKEKLCIKSLQCEFMSSMLISLDYTEDDCYPKSCILTDECSVLFREMEC